MSLHAVDDLEEAFAATRAFLWPFDAGTWLKLAVVAFFVGGASGGNVPTSGMQFDGGTPAGPGPGPGDVDPSQVTGEALALVLGVVAVLVVLGLLLGFVASVMEFVLVQSLREEAVHVRRYFRAHWRAGARLFGFRLGLTVLFAALVALPVLAFVFATGGIGAIGGPGDVFGLLALLIPLAVVVGVLFTLINGFTTFFVVPVMLVEGRGVLSAWRRFYATMRTEWKEYLAFVGLTFVLTLVAGTAVGFVVGVVALVVLGPIVVVGLVGAIASGASLPVLVGVGLLGLLGLVVVLFVAALVRVPVVTYFRYYAMLLLGDTDPDLDPVPERRRAIRSSDDAPDGSATEAA